MATELKRWQGPAPETCDLCAKPITDWFVDGKTRLGPWAIMCTVCFFNGAGVGLGTGKGQQYSLVINKWMKVAG